MELAARAEVDDLSRLFQGFSRAFDEIVRSGQPRMSLEMALVRLARRPALLPLDELLSRVGELEKRLGGAPPPGPAPRGGGGGGGGGRSLGTPASIVPPVSAVSPEPPGPRSHGMLALVSPEPEAAVTPTPTSGVKPVAVAVPDLDVWRSIVERVRPARPALASVLEHAVPLELNPRRVTLGFEPGAAFFAARASETESLEALTREIRDHFAAPTQVAIDLSARPGPTLKTVASLDAEKRSADLAKARAAVEDHPVVREVVRLFGAQLRDVKLPSGET